ncbi:MAG: hypothetical protein ACREO1_12580 [Arenimonas sp.]
MFKLILGAAIFSMATLATAQNVDVKVTATTKEAVATENINIRANMSGVASFYKPRCITDTGTRIKHRAKDKNGCNGLAGNSYDRDDLDRTGALTVGEALMHLDPSISIRY